jgi:hypothetical protein
LEVRGLVLSLGFLAACGFHVSSGSSSDDADLPADGPRPPDASLPDTNPCVGPDGDGDGKVDVCDPCPLDSPDDPDGDGVCTAVDRCLAGNDDNDDDGDSLPDACDEWPCGAAPTAPPATVTWATGNENVTLSNITVAGTGQRVVANPGQVLAVSATYSIVDCQCPGCIDQIEIGLIPGGKHGCLYNGNPGGASCNTPTSATAMRNVTAPTTPGTYSLRFNRGNDSSCQGNGVWWANVPPAVGNTFAILCVR